MSTSSAAAARPAPARTTAPSPARRSTPALLPRLRVVRAPQSSRSRVPYVLLCAAVLGGSLVGVLLLNTAMADGAYESRALQVEIARLAQTEQSLALELDRAASPQSLAARAQAQGMVQDSTPAFLRLADGAVIGDPTPAGR